MPIIKFPTKPDQSPFFKGIKEDGYHIFSLKNAKKPDFYPNEFPDYPGVKLKKIKVGDKITVRVFFKVGSGKDIRADGGYVDLEVEHVEDDTLFAVILTELPGEFPLKTGETIELFEEEILCKADEDKHDHQI